MKTCSYRGYAEILPNGKCSNCKEEIKREDRVYSNMWYLPINGLRIDAKDHKFLIQCPNCKMFIEL